MKIPNWRFWLALLFQSVLVLTIPADAIYTRIFGETVVLQTLPVDPYDFLRGYSQTLRYDISTIANLKQLPGWEDISESQEFYVILEAPSQSTQPPSPWKAIAVQQDLPTQLLDNQVALRAHKANYRLIKYGLEKYYIPESQIKEINTKINQIQGNNPQNFIVEIKVDSRGKATLISFWLGDERYEF